MLKFFCGWKRKVGCVTLVVACVLAAWWAHSYGPGDQFIFIITGFESKNGYIHLVRLDGALAVKSGKEIYVDTGSLNLPYWPIVVPLTAVSAWLLLSKPQSKSESQMTPASENA